MNAEIVGRKTQPGSLGKKSRVSFMTFSVCVRAMEYGPAAAQDMTPSLLRGTHSAHDLIK